jgi:hypothetical protein
MPGFGCVGSLAFPHIVNLATPDPQARQKSVSFQEV